ncbi:MAG: site-2 protease family protein [Thermodesulfobacteriota bacterium]|nr:site-2 protease family protein [Thermodesulfobacteriota bacterium]
MPENILIQVPFILDFSNLQFDKAVIFLIAILVTITINAEGQAFMASLLGDSPKDATDRFHFNPLLHINLPGLICFAVAGFGWPKQIKINSDGFKHPDRYRVMVKFAGAFANLLLASIAGSIVWAFTLFGMEDQVFSIIAAMNIMVFVFNIIPVPPLAGASLISLLVPEKLKNSSGARYFSIIFPYLFVFFLLFMRTNKLPILLNHYLDPVVKSLFMFMSN